MIKINDSNNNYFHKNKSTSTIYYSPENYYTNITNLKNENNDINFQRNEKNNNINNNIINGYNDFNNKTTSTKTNSNNTTYKNKSENRKNKNKNERNKKNETIHITTQHNSELKAITPFSGGEQKPVSNEKTDKEKEKEKNMPYFLLNLGKLVRK